MFWGKGNDFDQATTGILILFEFFHCSLDNILFRLSAFIFHIKIRAFKMNTQDFSTLWVFLFNFRNFRNCFLQSVM